MTTGGFLDFPNCYVCGSDNPHGLHISFHADGPNGCRAEYVARSEHTGWPDMIHGGVLFALMDEAVAWALIYAGLHGVTARGEFRFCAPVTVGMPLAITARVVSRRGKVVQARAEIRDATSADTLIAEMTASMYLAGVEQQTASRS